MNKGLFLTLFFVFIILSGIFFIRGDYTHEWDEARHSCAGYLYYSWIESGFPDWTEFSANWEKHIPGHFGWFMSIQNVARLILM